MKDQLTYTFETSESSRKERGLKCRKVARSSVSIRLIEAGNGCEMCIPSRLEELRKIEDVNYRESRWEQLHFRLISNEIAYGTA